MKLTTIIGLEIHVQLKTKSKMFCGCDNNGEDKPANTTICPICMGHPGTLPVANRQAIQWTITAGLALNCTMPERFEFERKNYFYPDLPKGYQITSSTHPPCGPGQLSIAVNGESRTIGINHIHLEEDAAKNFHSSDGTHTLIDFNRAGTPLMEIVTEADVRSPLEAKLFLQELRLIMRYLDISDADMEKGHLRCDANISLTKQQPDHIDLQKLSPKTEIKNLNSFKAVERALEYEIKRQTKLWEAGTPPTEQSTRGWDENKGITESQRIKEQLHDYRYFPEPDLPPMTLNPASGGIDVAALQVLLPELPAARRRRFVDEYNLSPENARVLTDDSALATFFEQTLSELRAWLIALGATEGTDEEVWQQHRGALAKITCNWLVNKLLALVYRDTKTIDTTVEITAENFAEFITLIHQNRINSTIGQKVLESMYQTGHDPSDILEQGELKADASINIDEIVDTILKENPAQVDQYKKGKTTVVQYFVGQAMRKTKGQADPETLRELIESKLAQ